MTSPFPHNLTDVLNTLKNQVVLVAGHIRPDGDCIGAQIALTRVLCSQGITAYLAQAEAIPNILIPFINNTPVWDCTQGLPPIPYALVSVDAADRQRLSPLFGDHAVTALFDHHRSTRPYAQLNFIAPEAAATAELLTQLFIDNDLPIDTISAQALYVGLLTDTGQFRHSSTTGHTLRLAATLLENGANPEAAAHQLFEQETLPRLALRQHFLSTLKLELSGQLCVGFLEAASYKKTQTLPEDAEGFVDYTRMVQGVLMGALIEDQGTQVKGSLRARSPHLRLDLLASLFGGGGHACAAGFKVDEPLSTFYPRFLELVAEHLTNTAQ